MRGSVLRTELYALDGSARSDRPFTVTERQMGLREEDPPAAAELRERIFFAHEVARRTTEWERGEQPRTVVVFTTDHDHFGQPTRTVSIAVPRGRDPRARLAAPPPEPYLATCTLTEYARSDLARGYMVDRVARLTTFEVLDDGRPSAAELRDAVTAADPGDRDLLRVIEHVRTFYDGAPEVGLPLGRLGEHGLQTRAEALAFTDAFLADVVGVRPPYLDATPAWTDDYPVEFRALVPALAGYVRYGEGEIAGSPGGYYVTTRRLRYDFHAGDGPARGLVVAARDARGALARLKYDGFGCCVIRETDAAGLVRELTHDYRVLRPRTETDPNGTLTRVAYSPLGLVRAQHTSGKDGAGDAAEPSVRVDYDLLAFQQRRQPISARTIRRVRHDSDPDVAPDERDATIQTVDYTDGFGRLLQSRTQAEDVQFGDERSGAGVIDEDQGKLVTATAGTPRPAGAPERVIVSGWQRYDNKGRVIARFEPFRSEGWEFAEPVEAELGRQTTMTFDALGRGVRAVGPDGSEHRVVHGVPVDLARPDSFDPTPWETYTYDPNDNAGRTHRDTSAAYRTHWNTPSSVETDALGRAVATVARNGPDPDDRHVTETAYDIRGNVGAITDALGRRAFTYRHDLAGRRWRSESIDAGRIDTVPGALDETIESRDARGALSLAALDVLQRPIRTWARDGATAPVTLRQRIDYGDGGAAAQPAATRAAARERNQLGRPVASYDEAGLVTLERYDFNGRVTESARRVIADAPILAVYERAAAAGWKIAPFTVDWAPRPGQSQAEREAELLEATEYRTATRFDALGRIVEQLLPEDVTGRRRVLRPAYDPESRLSGVTLDGEPVVERIAYDARGRRTLIAYGCGVMTRCAYDPSTLLLARVRSERYTKPDELTYRPAGPPLQDLGYDHDLIGNVLAIHDRTPGSGIPGNPDAFGTADPALGELLIRGEALERRFGYDAVYRLVSATGRECDTPPDDPWWIGAPRCADLTRARAYTEGYHYDRAGNLLQLTHHNGSGGSRTAFEHGANDNRLQRVGNGSPVDYEFDAAGNLRAETSLRHFEWNHANRLKAFGTQTAGAEPSVHAHYLYDPTGARVKKLVR
jgi:hypothetical protein